MDVLCSLIRSNCRSLTGLSFLFMALPCSLCVYYSSRRLTARPRRDQLFDLLAAVVDEDARDADDDPATMRARLA